MARAITNPKRRTLNFPLAPLAAFLFALVIDVVAMVENFAKENRPFKIGIRIRGVRHFYKITSTLMPFHYAD